MIEQDSMNAVRERAAGLDARKMEIASTIRLARPGLDAAVETRTSGALPSGLAGQWHSVIRRAATDKLCSAQHVDFPGENGNENFFLQGG